MKIRLNFDRENIRLLALLVKKLQIFVKKILIEKYNFNYYVFYLKI
ncbi:hypothetical protein [Spiroplasma poulsonii]|nr:hypothetical protein [Spiroplasma poulsonii]